jgi:hypothetical protein
MSRTTFTRDIAEIASGHLLEPDIVEALVLVESGGHPAAWNPEPQYRYLWNVKTWQPFRALSAAEILSSSPPADFPTLAGDRDQEWWGQRVSWGLMQVMGAVARERGYRQPYLPELVRDVRGNLHLGCAHLAAMLRWADGDYEKALGAYNAGRGGAVGPVGRAYAAKVMAHVAQLRRER